MYVVDDDEDFRDSLIALIVSRDYQGDGFASAAAFVAAEPSLHPGVLLLDLRMPMRGGLDLLESGDIPLDRFAVIVLTGHGDVNNAVRSLKAGAVDFIEKPFASDALLDAIGTAQSLLGNRRAADETRRRAELQIKRLSPRERDVLKQLAAGESNKRIAANLGLSPRTVEMHRANMMDKLNVRSASEAVHIAVVAGILGDPGRDELG
ncbi:DNA-binding response regulator [Sphingomonas ginkgonis]|uniref:DNA-binding response regulator n=1 Tax=Sphingomonas ginkgonis TaxID=2315330 RepID=A0A3R9YL35_9SPHN|nr:DNA-binding response regulator [Sphingomonas ginkgonis]